MTNSDSKREQEIRDVEKLAAEFHTIYQQEAKRQGDVRHKDAYADLSENVKEFDRVLARHVNDLLRKERLAGEVEMRDKFLAIAKAWKHVASLGYDEVDGYTTRSAAYKYCAERIEDLPLSPTSAQELDRLIKSAEVNAAVAMRDENLSRLKGRQRGLTVGSPAWFETERAIQEIEAAPLTQPQQDFVDRLIKSARAEAYRRCAEKASQDAEPGEMALCNLYEQWAQALESPTTQDELSGPVECTCDRTSWPGNQFPTLHEVGCPLESNMLRVPRSAEGGK